VIQAAGVDLTNPMAKANCLTGRGRPAGAVRGEEKRAPCCDYPQLLEAIYFIHMWFHHHKIHIQNRRVFWVIVWRIVCMYCTPYVHTGLLSTHLPPQNNSLSLLDKRARRQES